MLGTYFYFLSNISDIRINQYGILLIYCYAVISVQIGDCTVCGSFL